MVHTKICTHTKNNVRTDKTDKTDSGQSGTRAFQQQHSFFFVNLDLLRRNVQ